MAKGVTLVPELVIHGSYGELIGYDIRNNTNETLFQAEVQQVEAKITNAKKELNLSGTRHTFHKLMSTTGEGTIRRLKVTSDFLRLVGNTMHPREGRPTTQGRRIHANIGFRTSLIVNLDDPEAIDYESVRLNGVKFWEINLGWQVNEVIEESIPFTFETVEFINAIVGDVLVNSYATRYTEQTNL